MLPADERRLDVLADPAAPALVRRWLKAWLAELGWPPGQTDDLVLVLSEAVCNVVEHAYPPATTGWAHVHAQHTVDVGGHRRIVLTVTDQGRWRPLSVDPAKAHRGLTLMRALAETARFDTAPGGTRVALTSHPVTTWKRSSGGETRPRSAREEGGLRRLPRPRNADQQRHAAH